MHVSGILNVKWGSYLGHNLALPLLTVIVGKKNDADKCVVVTEAKDADKPVKVEFSVPTTGSLAPGTPKWANYVKGIVQYFKGTVVGFNAVIVTSVPIGGGLSSSASLEVSLYTFLEALTGETDTLRKDKALLCQKAEHEFAKMPCGIMDQFISVMGQAGTALLIDCRSMQETAIPITDPEIAVIITNSNVKRSLASSAYAERRAQCQAAAKALGKSSLRDANENEIDGLREKDPLLYKRAKHVVTENKRTEQAAEALKAGDLQKFGELMVASHESLKTDYEVSCKELDELVAAALEVDGVLGSRMTGGGFGGCTVTLAPKKTAENVIANMKKKYEGEPVFYIMEPAEGTRVLTIPK
ncbi:galactokinase-like isoform X2 [Zootermopsis nevadensis]|uniref:galactokinase-like isoform X2 n=1 Tax=Zootermopsis nevadensis TaxID=136037 RepID=UPI000B8EC8BB|nr:galactokinase-like isoform X2 [Zootermopsis nevadensis]